MRRGNSVIAFFSLIFISFSIFDSKNGISVVNTQALSYGKRTRTFPQRAVTPGEALEIRDLPPFRCFANTTPSFQ